MSWACTITEEAVSVHSTIHNSRIHTHLETSSFSSSSLAYVRLHNLTDSSPINGDSRDFLPHYIFEPVKSQTCSTDDLSDFTWFVSSFNISSLVKQSLLYSHTQTHHFPSPLSSQRHNNFCIHRVCLGTINMVSLVCPLFLHPFLLPSSLRCFFSMSLLILSSAILPFPFPFHQLSGSSSLLFLSSPLLHFQVDSPNTRKIIIRIRRDDLPYSF